jgi:hypothetical protein
VIGFVDDAVAEFDHSLSFFGSHQSPPKDKNLYEIFMPKEGAGVNQIHPSIQAKLTQNFTSTQPSFPRIVATKLCVLLFGRREIFYGRTNPGSLLGIN